jgi:hypothetical protein
VLLAAPAAGQGAVLRIRVVDDSTGAGIARAEVLLDGHSALLTDSAGRLRLGELPAGESTLKASRLGYRPERIAVRLAPGEQMEVDVALRPQLLALPELVVDVKAMDARLREVRFYERRRQGLGLAWDWHDLREGAATTREFLDRLPGFSVRPAGTDDGWVLESHRGPGVAPCTALILVDGQLADPRRLASIQLDQIAAVEAYLGPASTPTEIAVLTSGARCGVVALWIRTGP